jgi:hypothetical protein
MLLGAVPIGHKRFQPFPIARPEPDLDIALHALVVQQKPAPRNFLFRSDH